MGTFGTLSLALFWLNPLGLILALTAFALVPAARKERTVLTRDLRTAHDQVVRRSIWFASLSAALQVLTLTAALIYRFSKRTK